MRSSLYEQVLTRQGVSWNYMPRLDLNAIDVKAGLRNQARLLEPEDLELQEQYYTLTKEGSEPPAIVVWKRKNKNIWVPIDGNQRIQAAKKANKKTVDAYVVDTTDEEILYRITTNFNNLVNGKRVSKEETLEHATTMVTRFNWPMKRAAEEYGLNWRTLQTRCTAEKLRGVLVNAGMNKVCGLSDTKLEKINSVITLGEDVFIGVASTVFNSGLSESDIDLLKENIAKARSYPEKVKAVNEFTTSELVKQRKAETKNGTVLRSAYTPTPGERLFRELKEIQKLKENYSVDLLRRGGVYEKEMREVVVEVADFLVLTFGLGARPVQPPPSQPHSHSQNSETASLN